MDFDTLNKKLKTEKPLSKSDLDFYTEEIFKYYREVGYPNYERKEGDSLKKYTLIQNIDTDKYYDFDNKICKKYQSLNGFLFSFFPNWISVPCGPSGESLEACWNDDERLKAAIRKTLVWLPKHHEVWSANRIRQNSKVFCSGQSVSNFNPVTAKTLYNMFGNDGTILDMCAGWGGRMMGFVGSNCTKYIGYDPSTETYNGLVNLKKDYYKTIKNHKIVELHKLGCENMITKDVEVDFAFTSPPYFDCEKYSDEKTQSYKKFSTKDLWCEGFLGGMYKNVYKVLKPNCKMAINIANTTQYDWLEEESVLQAEKNGFKLIDTMKYELSSIGGKGSKYEPIFIFEKVIEK